MNNFFRLIVIFASVLLLTGCDKETKTYYSYGKDNSCYQDKPIKNCDKFKPYDKLTVGLNKQNNEVIYELSAVGLDDSNTIFNKLSNCNIIDLNNFSCEDFVFINGRNTNYKALGNKVLVFSSSSLLFKSMLISKSHLNKRSIELFDDFNDNFESYDYLIYILFGIYILIIFNDGWKANEKH